MNKLFSIVLIMMLSMPVALSAVDDVAKNETESALAVNMLDEDVVDDAENQVNYKTPLDKKKILKKFIVAMGAVAGSSFLIFFGLTAYNRVRERLLGYHAVENCEVSLESPQNYEEAVRVFLDKTNW